MTARTPTAAERSAHELLCGMYCRDLDGRRERGLPLPADHLQLEQALRALDRRVGVGDRADDRSGLAGEGLHRWMFQNRLDLPLLTQDDRTAGYLLADELVTHAARGQSPVEPRIAGTRKKGRPSVGGPRGAVPRG